VKVAAVVTIATALAGVAVLAASTAQAAAPASSHPRMLLDAPLREAWQAQIAQPHSPVARAIAMCSDAGTTHKYDGAQYQGSEWAKVLQACLVAWAATGDAHHAATSIRFFTALIDDLDQIGDGKGGDRAAWRDSGYAIRMLAPYTALAYDWLHDQLAPELRARARQRWSSWLTWYREKGYRSRAPGNNYQAGYLISATMIAIAEAGEGDPALWSWVADELWGKDMAAALASGGILERDARCAGREPGEQVERARWTSPPPGRYRVGVDFLETCGGASEEVPYTLLVEVDGVRQELTGRARLAERQPLVLEFRVAAPAAREVR